MFYLSSESQLTLILSANGVLSLIRISYFLNYHYSFITLLPSKIPQFWEGALPIFLGAQLVTKNNTEYHCKCFTKFI